MSHIPPDEKKGAFKIPISWIVNILLVISAGTLVTHFLDIEDWELDIDMPEAIITSLLVFLLLAVRCALSQRGKKGQDKFFLHLPFHSPRPVPTDASVR